MRIRFTFLDDFEVEDMEEAYSFLLEYLADCVDHEDVDSFGFEILQDEQESDTVIT